MYSPAYDKLTATERSGYEAFIRDETIDKGAKSVIETGDIGAFAEYVSGWFVAAREAFAEGAISSVMADEYSTHEPANPYPSGSTVEYSCNRGYKGENAWFRVSDRELKPRARQWHQGFVWQQAQ